MNIILVVVLLAIAYMIFKKKEQFIDMISTRSTRNMNYDIRCTPNAGEPNFLFNMPGAYPIQYERCLQ